MREGVSPIGGVWLQTMWATGRRTRSPWRANSLLCPTTSSIQAPPRFSACSRGASRGSTRSAGRQQEQRGLHASRGGAASAGAHGPSAHRTGVGVEEEEGLGLATLLDPEEPHVLVPDRHLPIRRLDLDVKEPLGAAAAPRDTCQGRGVGVRHRGSPLTQTCPRGRWAGRSRAGSSRP